MKENLTEMIFILDRSGSMNRLSNDTIGGYNSLIEQQRKEDGEARITTVLFDDKYEILYDNMDLKDVKELTDKEYYARGNTALLDAIGKTIQTVGHRLNITPEEDKPSKVVVVITTDGLENASREYTKPEVFEMIKEQQDKYNWTFMFLGANISSIHEAAALGMDVDYARNYSATKNGTETLYESISKTMSVMRKVGSKKMSKESCEFREIQKNLNEIE